MTTWIRKYEPAKLQFDGTCPDCGCGLHGTDCSNTNCDSRRKVHGIPPVKTEEAPVGESVPENGPPKEWEMICPSCREKLYVVAEQAMCMKQGCERRMKAA